MANTRIHTLEKSGDVTYSNSKLFNDDFLTNKAIGADHIVNKENEIISGKLFFCIEKFVFSNQTNDKIISLIGDESSIVGRKFVREFQSLVGFLVDDLNEIFAIPPPDSVLREVSLKLFFEHPDLSKRYETEMKAGFFSDELFVVSKKTIFFLIFSICIFILSFCSLSLSLFHFRIVYRKN